MGAGIAGAQAPSEVAGERTEVFGGFSYLALNYQRGFANAGLPGWDAAWSTPLKGSIALAVDGAGCYQGHDLGAPFYLHFLTAGAKFEKRQPGRTWFAQATAGFAHLNGTTGESIGAFNAVTIPNLASNFTLAIVAGGGMDMKFGERLRWRFAADYIHTNFTSVNDQIHGVTASNVRVTTGPVFRF
jgi:hypothetical protein